MSGKKIISKKSALKRLDEIVDNIHRVDIIEVKKNSGLSGWHDTNMGFTIYSDGVEIIETLSTHGEKVVEYSGILYVKPLGCIFHFDHYKP